MSTHQLSRIHPTVILQPLSHTPRHRPRPHRTWTRIEEGRRGHSTRLSCLGRSHHHKSTWWEAKEKHIFEELGGCVAGGDCTVHCRKWGRGCVRRISRPRLPHVPWIYNVSTAEHRSWCPPVSRCYPIMMNVLQLLLANLKNIQRCNNHCHLYPSRLQGPLREKSRMKEFSLSFKEPAFCVELERAFRSSLWRVAAFGRVTSIMWRLSRWIMKVIYFTRFRDALMILIMI